MEKEVSSFLKQLGQPNESGLLAQLSKVMDSDFIIPEQTLNEEYENDTFLKEISDDILDKMTNKEILYKPLLVLRDRYALYIHNLKKKKKPH